MLPHKRAANKHSWRCLKHVCCFLSQSVSLSVRPSAYLSISILSPRLPVRSPVCLFVRPSSVCLSLCPFVRPSVCLCVCMYICLSVHPYICLFTCLSVSVRSSICLSCHPSVSPFGRLSIPFTVQNALKHINSGSRPRHHHT